MSSRLGESVSLERDGVSLKMRMGRLGERSRQNLRRAFDILALVRRARLGENISSPSLFHACKAEKPHKVTSRLPTNHLHMINIPFKNPKHRTTLRHTKIALELKNLASLTFLGAREWSSNSENVTQAQQLHQLR